MRLTGSIGSGQSVAPQPAEINGDLLADRDLRLAVGVIQRPPLLVLPLPEQRMHEIGQRHAAAVRRDVCVEFEMRRREDHLRAGGKLERRIDHDLLAARNVEPAQLGGIECVRIEQRRPDPIVGQHRRGVQRIGDPGRSAEHDPRVGCGGEAESRIAAERELALERRNILRQLVAVGDAVRPLRGLA